MALPRCDRPPNEVHAITAEFELIIGEEYCGTVGTAHAVNLFVRDVRSGRQVEIFSYGHDGKHFGPLDANHTPAGLGVLGAIETTEPDVHAITVHGISDIVVDRPNAFGHQFHVGSADFPEVVK